MWWYLLLGTDGRAGYVYTTMLVKPYIEETCMMQVPAYNIYLIQFPKLLRF